LAAGLLDQTFIVADAGRVGFFQIGSGSVRSRNSNKRSILSAASPATNSLTYFSGARLIHISGRYQEATMLLKSDYRVFPTLVGCSLFAWAAGEQLRFSHPSPSQILTVGTAASTSSVSAIGFNTTTFAKLDPPPPVAPPGDRQNQGCPFHLSSSGSSHGLRPALTNGPVAGVLPR
jgi:hypothetical protein